MSRTIDELVEVVMADLRTTSLPLPRVEPGAGQTEPPTEMLMLYAPDGSGAGVVMDLRASDADRLMQIADHVQEWAIEELGAMRLPTNWPQCPAHPDNHPMEPQVRGGRAIWSCPSGADVTIPIGRLAG